MSNKDIENIILTAAVITVILLFMWWKCLMLVPMYPNSVCYNSVGALTGGGSSGGSSSGCPVCVCREPSTLTTDNRTSSTVPCPDGGRYTITGVTVTTGCYCPSGYAWNPDTMLCQITV